MTFPDTALTITVELALGADLAASPQSWTWTDITDYVLARDDIVIRRGRADEQNQAEPSTATLTLNNAGGRFTPANPAGPYFGLLGRNTPMRVRVNAGLGTYTRFTGYLSEWPPRWDPSENDNWVSVVASGVLRRLSATNSPTRSAIHAQVLYEAEFGGLRAYWPMEDGPAANLAAPAYGDMGLVPNGVSFAAVAGPAGSDRVPELAQGGSLRTVTAIPPAGSTQWRIEFLQQIDTAGANHCPMEWTTYGAVSSWRIRNNTAGSIVLEAFSPAGTELLAGTVSVPVNAFTGKWLYVTVTGAQSGADIVATLSVDDLDGGGTEIDSAVLTGRTIGDIAKVAVNPAGASTSSGLRSVGHVSVYTTTIAINKVPALTGYDGWSAALRFAGVCARAGVAYDASTIFDESLAMGPQSRGGVVDLLREAEAADCALLVERRTGELGFDPHVRWENRPVALALDYAVGDIAPPFEPVSDDRLTRNDVTVTRANGASGRVIEDGGPLGVDAIGTYDDQFSLNLYDDRQPTQVAGWLVSAGTVDEYRYPAVHLALHRTPQLIEAWLNLDLGHRLTIANLPAWISPDTADQTLHGYTERLNSRSWQAVLTTAPFAARRVAVLAADDGDTGEFLGYLVPDSCQLAAAATSTATTWSVTSSPLWSVHADDYTPGITVTVGGEQVVVTGCSGSTNPQTLTVTRSANGVSKAHPSGTDLAITYPGVAGL